MKKKAINLAQAPMAVKRVLFAFLFFSVWAAPNVGANPSLSEEKVNEEQVLQDGKQVTVKGSVVDSKNEPLIGVSVKVVGTSIGTATDFDGNFTINVPRIGSVLEFTYVGYTSQKVTVGNNATLTIVMEDDSQVLSTVVVTAPIGVQRPPKAIGYSVSSVSAKQLTEAGNTNFASALYGKAAGVKITTPPGGATGAVNVQIRGINSLNYNQQPLYVVDGVMIRNDGQNGSKGANNDGYWADQKIRGNGISDINPMDIESLTILKGASASALYGSDAGSGVVVITTKKGSQNQGLGIELNYNGAFESVSNLPKYQYKYGPGYSPSVNEANGADANGWYFDGKENVSGGQRPYFRAYGQFGPAYDGREVTWWDGSVQSYSARKNQLKEAFQVGYTSNLNVALSKQTDILNYRLSYTRLDYTGTQMNSEMQKNNFNLNSTVKLHKDLSLDVVANYINTKTSNRPELLDRLLNNYDGFFNTAEDFSIFKRKYQTSDGYKYVTLANKERNPEEALVFTTRPYAVLDYYWRRLKNKYEEEENRIITSATLNWDIMPKLKLRGRVGNDFTALNIEDKQFVEVAPEYVKTEGSGGYRIDKNQYSTIYGDALLTYSDKFSSDFDFALAGGIQGRDEKYRTQYSSTANGLIIDNWFSLDNSRNQLNTGTSTTNLAKYAYLGILNLAYKNYLFLEATARQEYNSALPPKNNSYFYWSTNMGFVFTDAVSVPKWLSYGKVRASYGIVGNGCPPYVANIAYRQKVLQTTQGSVPGITLFSPTYGNLDLKPEMKHEWEFGLEARFWDDRLSFDASYYTNTVKNQIAELELPYSSGAERQILNIGEIGSNGLELAVSVTPFIGDFRWTTRFNVGFNSSKVKSYNYGMKEYSFWSADESSIKISAVEGEKLGNIYSFDIKRDEATGQALISDEGYYIIDDSKFVKLGNIMPTAVGGWSNTFNYKNFSLDVMIDYRFGGQMISPGTKYQTGAGRFENTMKYRDAENGGIAWTYTGQGGKTYQRNDGVILEGIKASNKEKNTTVISAADYYINTFTWGASGWNSAMVEDNSYIKLRELTVGYSLPSSIANKMYMKDIRVSLFGRNLFYFWKTLENVDPEAPVGSKWYSQGVDAGSTLASKTLGFSISAKF